MLEKALIFVALRPVELSFGFFKSGRPIVLPGNVMDGLCLHLWSKKAP